VAGDKIRGSAYFSKGVKAKNLKVAIFTEDGTAAGETYTDVNGEFSFLPTLKTGYRLEISAPDGHKAEYFIARPALSGTLPKPDQSLPGQQPAVPADQDQSAANGRLSEQKLAAEISRQLFPLQQQLDELRHQTGFRDLIGGIGYIVGIAGLIAFYLARKKTK
jgi:nickel transport protein